MVFKIPSSFENFVWFNLLYNWMCFGLLNDLINSFLSTWSERHSRKYSVISIHSPPFSIYMLIWQIRPAFLWKELIESLLIFISLQQLHFLSKFSWTSSAYFYLFNKNGFIIALPSIFSKWGLCFPLRTFIFFGV